MIKKLGVDFGTSYTKIAYPDPDDHHHPLLFYYSNDQRGSPYISTEISYVPQKDPEKEKDSRFIGHLAFEHIYDSSSVVFYRDFKILLPLLPSDLKPSEWINGRTPESITRAYFEELLTEGRYSFVKRKGEFEQLLVSVPEIWYKDPANAGPDRLLKVFEDLGIPKEKVQLKSEPVCAAAYYVYRQQQHPDQPKNYNLLVCDMGGGTFDVALCRVNGSYIRVLYHNGSGERGIGMAGASFDQSCVKAACTSALGKHPDNHNDFYRLLRAFENEKLSPRLDTWKMINEQNAQNPRFKDEIVYKFDGDTFKVTIGQAWQALLPVRGEIHNVITRVREVCTQNNWNIDQAIIVGGFGHYAPVQQAILDCLPDVNTSQDDILENERYSAIAKGAFYIVNEFIQVTEPFQHTLGIIVNGYFDGVYEINREIPIIEAGQACAGMTETKFAIKSNGERFTVSVNEQLNAPLPIFVRPNGHMPSRSLSLSEQQKWPERGEYSVGFIIDRSNRAKLIFENQSKYSSVEYLVGELTLD